MVRKKWTVSECDKDLAAQIAEDFSVDPLTAYILVSRGITDYDEIEEFLDPSAPLMIDPFSFADMDKAVRRIQLAIDDFQKIAVFGDYDADGITATALLYSYLEMREANVVRYIPDRLTEGYGLSCDSVRELAEQGVKLIITVDNGISAVEEAELCKSLGVDLVVTDHHKVGEKLPDAVAVVNPHRKDCPSEFKDFSGVGVAFKLVSALEGGDEDSMLDEFGDLVAIGTVADVVNLKGENRSLVRYGLNTINTSPRIGLKVLLEKSAGQGKKIGASSAAFTICPRINATGRMGSAEKALDLLLCDDEITAERLVEEINSMNQARQKTETEIFGEVSAMLAEKPGLSRDSVIVVASEGWHQGVIGIVASRIAERYGKPAVVISKNGSEARGSCRSIEGFSIFKAIEAVSDCLTHFGGHTLAAGIGLNSDRIEEFRIRINDYADSVEMPFPVQKIDCRINPGSISLDILNALDVMEPFGAGNPQPCFGLYGVKIEDFSSIGDGRHMRLTISKNDARTGAVWFGMQEKLFPYSRGDIVDLAVTLDRNIYNGETRISVNVKNIRPSHTDENKVLLGRRLYEKVLGEMPLSREQAECALPDRNIQVEVFKHIKMSKPVDDSFEQICMHLGDDGTEYCKVAVAVAVMLEMGVITKTNGGRLAPAETSGKVDLNDSVLMKRIKNYM